MKPVFPDIPESIPHGDMPGDKVVIGAEHEAKAQLIFTRLKDLLPPEAGGRFVLAVCGGSGVGKSEIASVLAYYLNCSGTGAYVLSGDNYPHRIPRDNDTERLRVFREGGMKGLVSYGLLTPAVTSDLRMLWTQERDADPKAIGEYPWLAIYQKAGRCALAGYLGTENEIGFAELSDILSRFHQGENEIWLRRLGRTPEELWYDRVDFSAVRVLIVEWTHGNSDCLQGVDLPVLLNSTPAETLAHRRALNRDGKTDSAFTTMVLAIEQKKLEAQACKARLIISKQGQEISYAEYRQLMALE